MSYNGWSDWETWNVNLWAMNDEPTYHRVMERVQDFHDSGTEFDGRAARDLAEEIFPHGTPDMDSSAEMADVNWLEIAEAWDE